MGLDLSFADFLFVSFGVALGALAQGLVGFGANLLAAPMLAIVAPAALPGTMILLPLPLQVLMVRNEHSGIDWRNVGWSTLGQLPGAAVGAWMVTVIARERLSLLTGAFVLAGVAISLVGSTVPFTRQAKLGTGFVSGVMGTATSIGGPPLALLYQHHEGRVLRPTLAACFLMGSAVSLPALLLAGSMEWWHLRLAIALVPSLLLGMGLSRVAVRHLDGSRLRPAVLGLATVAAALAIGRGLGVIG